MHSICQQFSRVVYADTPIHQLGQGEIVTIDTLNLGEDISHRITESFRLEKIQDLSPVQQHFDTMLDASSNNLHA